MEKRYLAMWMWLREGKLQKWKQLTSACRLRLKIVKNICDKIDFHVARQTCWCKKTYIGTE